MATDLHRILQRMDKQVVPRAVSYALPGRPAGVRVARTPSPANPGLALGQLHLIAAATRGEVPAFNQLVQFYQASLYYTAYRMMGDGEAAADATQDALISAFKHLRSFRGGSFKAWLLRIVTNACYDQLRTQKRQPTLSLDAAVSDAEAAEEPGWAVAQGESPQEFVERMELGALLRKGLDTLPDDKRLTLILSDLEGLKYHEIAQVTGSNIGTVRSRLSRARAQMRDLLVAQSVITPGYLRSHPSPGPDVSAR